MTLYSRTRARRSLFDTLASRFVAQAATAVGYVVMVRGMREEDFGVFNLLYAVIPLISTIASLGLEQMLRRFQPEYLAANNPVAAGRLQRLASGARLLVNLIVIAVLLLAWQWIAPVVQLGPYKPIFAIFGVVILLFFQVRILELSLASHMLHKYSTGWMAGLSIAKTIGYATIVVAGELTLLNAILVDLVAYVITYLGMLVAHRRHCPVLPEQRAFRFDAVERKRIFRYSMYFNFNDAGTLAINSRAENFFIAAFMNVVAVGAYSFYTRLSLMTQRMLPTRMLDNVIQPLFFAVKADAAATKIPRYFTLLVDLSLLFQVPILAYALAWHREIVQVLFAGKFIEYSFLLPLVVAFATINIVAVPVTMVAQYAERAAIVLISKLFGLYNIAALFVLIPLYGLTGAVLATGTAEVMKNLFVWWHVRRTARWANALPMLGTSILLWGAYVAACLGLKAAFAIGPLPQLVGGAVLAVGTALLHARSPALSLADRDVLGSVLHGREARLLTRLGVLNKPSSPSTSA